MHKTPFTETKFKKKLKKRYINDGVNVTNEDASDKSILTEQEWRAMRKRKGLLSK